MTWHVAGPSEYLVITGLFINDVKIAKKAWVILGQRWTKIDIKPVNYAFDVSAMSSEKLPFTLPATYTIGPDAEDTHALRRYAKLIAAHEHHAPHVNKTVEGIIEGETRVLAAGMPMEEIFKGSDEFKRRVKEGVQRELQKLGLHVYNANVMQLQDVPGHEYFSYLGKKAQKEAENRAKVDVAEAVLIGDTGAKEREGRTVQRNAKVKAETEMRVAEQEGAAEQKKAAVKAETTQVVNEKKQEIVKADNELAKMTAMLRKEAAIANVKAQKEVEVKKMEMQTEVERRKAEAQVEKLRAEEVVKSTIRKEVSQEEARADLFRRGREAEAHLYARLREAEAKTGLATADAVSSKQAAEAWLFTKVKEAEALRSRAAAIAYYVTVLSWAVLRALAVLLLLVHVNSWLAANRVGLPSADDSTSGLSNFFINNAIFHYLLPGSTSSHLPLPPPQINDEYNNNGVDTPPPKVPSPPQEHINANNNLHVHLDNNSNDGTIDIRSLSPANVTPPEVPPSTTSREHKPYA